MLWVPVPSAGKATVGHAFAVAADVVDAARQGERREKRACCVADVKGGAERAYWGVVPCAWPVEEPEAENDPPPTALREAVGFTLGRKRGSQDRRDVRDRGVF